VRDVIQNLQQDPDYYAKRTISYKLKATDPLYAMVCEYRNIEGNGGDGHNVDEEKWTGSVL